MNNVDLTGKRLADCPRCMTVHIVDKSATLLSCRECYRIFPLIPQEKEMVAEDNRTIEKEEPENNARIIGEITKTYADVLGTTFKDFEGKPIPTHTFFGTLSAFLIELEAHGVIERF